MFEAIKLRFSRPKPVKVKPEIAGGQIWVLQSKDDPFPPKSNGVRAEIIDCRAGWVRYKIANGFLFQDERMPVETFTAVYRPLHS